MGQPITWRNVDAPQFGDGNRMLLASQNGITSGFNQIGEILKAGQATADANWKVQRDNNTQAFLNTMSQFRNAEEFANAQKSGVFDQLRQQYGGQVDQAAIRAAEDGRLAILQERDLKAGQYSDQMKEREARPIVERLTAMALSNDKDLQRSAKEALGVYASSGMVPNAAELTGKFRVVDRQNTEWNQADQKYLDELQTNKARRNLMGAQAEQASAAAEHYRNETSSATTSLKAQLASAKSQNAAADLLIKNSPLDAGTMDTYEGKMKFLEGLKKLGIPDDEAKSVYQSFSTRFGNGVKVGERDGESGKREDVRIGLPVSTALAAVEGASPDSKLRPNWLIGSGRGDRAVSEVNRLMGERTYVDSLQAALQAQGIRYRPLTTTAPKVAVADDPYSPDVLTSVIQARKEKAMGMMSPSELETSRQTGRLPSRIRDMLYGRE